MRPGGFTWYRPYAQQWLDHESKLSAQALYPRSAFIKKRAIWFSRHQMALSLNFLKFHFITSFPIFCFHRYTPEHLHRSQNFFSPVLSVLTAGISFWLSDSLLTIDLISTYSDFLKFSGCSFLPSHWTFLLWCCFFFVLATYYHVDNFLSTTFS